ncbi:hypothetical protein ASPCAL14759 [Aspergillus calidoustus]|uniref:Cytochrome P450 n=1 Tax=Aspergillus calidoustus TaxID=454130 RepID=A0A0U5GHT2_ASPCI|nr:hypothetical protein ASPCAL14759 [Aspergillus calidoustus]
MVLVLGPEAIAELVFTRADDFAHSANMKLLAEAGLGYAGLMGMRGHEHKRLRKLFAPVFSPATLSKIGNPLWDSCQRLLDRLYDPQGHEAAAVNISQWSSVSVLELSGIGVFGQDPGWLARYSKLRDTLERRVATGHIQKMVLAIFPRSIRSLLMLTLFGRRELADLRYIRDVALDLARIEKEKQFASNMQKEGLTEDVGNSGRPYPHNIISVLLDDGEDGDNEHDDVACKSRDEYNEVLIGHILIFLVGASETTSASFQWMILELCRHPEVQTRLREEVESHWSSLLSSTSSSSVFHQLKALPYLRAVIDEVLRLHPTVILTEHEATRDTMILDTPIPKGTLLLCPPLAANSNPRVWGEVAALFNPDRWLLSERPINSRQYPCANMTFSHGPRACPGRSISRLVLACLTAGCVHQYEVSLDNPEQSYVPVESVYAKPAPDLIVRFTRRRPVP